jgi:hypothetical protein
LRGSIGGLRGIGLSGLGYIVALLHFQVKCRRGLCRLGSRFNGIRRRVQCNRRFVSAVRPPARLRVERPRLDVEQAGDGECRVDRDLAGGEATIDMFTICSVTRIVKLRPGSEIRGPMETEIVMSAVA